MTSLSAPPVWRSKLIELVGVSRIAEVSRSEEL